MTDDRSTPYIVFSGQGKVEVLEHDAGRARALIEDFYAARPEHDASTPPSDGEDGS